MVSIPGFNSTKVRNNKIKIVLKLKARQDMPRYSPWNENSFPTPYKIETGFSSRDYADGHTPEEDRRSQRTIRCENKNL